MKKNKRTNVYLRYEDNQVVDVKGTFLVNGKPVVSDSDFKEYAEREESEGIRHTKFKNNSDQYLDIGEMLGNKFTMLNNDADSSLSLSSTHSGNQFATMVAGAGSIGIEDTDTVGFTYKDEDADVDLKFTTSDMVGLKNINDTIDGQLDSIRETIADNKTEVDGQITSIYNKLDYQAGLINGVRTEVERGWDSQANYVPDMIRSATNGNLVSKNGWCVSDFLSVEVGHQYSFYVNQRYDANNFAIFYDKDKNLVRVVENTISSPYGQYPLFNHVWITALEGEAFMTFCDKLPTVDNVANLKVMHRTTEEPSKDYWLAEMPTHHNGLQSKQDLIEGLSGKKLVFNADGTVTWTNA